MLRYSTNFFLAVLLLLSTDKICAQKLSLVPYATGFYFPIDFKNCGDDRVFVAQNNGLILVVNSDGTVRPTPFLNIHPKVKYVDEGGFLGFTFSPNYKTDGKFYVYYTDSANGTINSVIEQYSVSASDSNIADINSAVTILVQPQIAVDHFGGNVAFGKDGFLYINFGDGGPDGDPYGHSQDMTTFLGKILRLDVSNSTTSQPYIIPPSNPFYNSAVPGLKKEIWASGLRNPYRSSFDRLTGDFWLPDVGEFLIEEVNFQSANSPGGQNYGWNIMEGTNCFNPSTGCDSTGLTLPIYEYHHTYSNAIIGGYAIRSPESKALFGTFIFTDYITQFVDGITQANGAFTGVTRLLDSIDLPNRAVSFGEDRLGSIYIVFADVPTIYRLDDTSYLRHPKAYITPVQENAGASYNLQGLQGRNLSYQWLVNNAIIPGATSPDYDVSSNGNYSLVVTNALGFSDTSDVFPFGALPLNLVSFTAQKISTGKIGLQWKVASEQNIAGYNVLRKQNNEVNFSNIGFVGSKSVNGVSASVVNYNFVDSSASPNSVIYYRLQMQSKDGHFIYSDIRKLISDDRIINFTMYPNPANGKLHIDLNGYNGPAVVLIYNYEGQKVKEQVINTQSSTVDLSRLKGFYIVQMSGTHGQNLIRKKLVVQ